MSKFIVFSIVVLFASIANAQIAFVPAPTCDAVADYAYQGYLNPRAIATINALDRHRFNNRAVFVGPNVCASRIVPTSGTTTIYSPAGWCDEARYFVKRDVLPVAMPATMNLQMMAAPATAPAPANSKPAERPVAPDGQINIRPTGKQG